MRKAKVLCADPPWLFEQGTTSNPSRFRGTVDQHYSAMSLEQLKAFPLPPIADDALLFLWRVQAMVEEAYELARAWDFAPGKGEVVWIKKTTQGNRWFGMGRVVRGEHEVCMICKRGRPEILSKSIRSCFEAQVPGGRHSAKPEVFYKDIVQQLSAGPYVELFARRRRRGWRTLGNDEAVTQWPPMARAA